MLDSLQLLSVLNGFGDQHHAWNFIASFVYNILSLVEYYVRTMTLKSCFLLVYHQRSVVLNIFQVWLRLKICALLCMLHEDRAMIKGYSNLLTPYHVVSKSLSCIIMHNMFQG